MAQRLLIMFVYSAIFLQLSRIQQVLVSPTDLVAFLIFANNLCGSKA